MPETLLPWAVLGGKPGLHPEERSRQWRKGKRNPKAYQEESFW